MNDKQRVKDFLDFLEQHPDNIIATDYYNHPYSSLRDSIIKTLQMAYSDGKVEGFNDCRGQELWDKTLISGKEDW